MNNTLGGKLLSGFGGYIDVRQYNIPSAQPVRLDVAEWKLEKFYLSKKCAHSGCYGSIARRRTGMDWKCYLKVWWDIDNKPELLLQNGWSVSLRLAIGDPLAWTLPPPGGYGLVASYYEAPSGLLTKFTTLDNSEGEDIVTCDLEIEANGHIFLLPHEQQWYSNYLSYINNRGWTN